MELQFIPANFVASSCSWDGRWICVKNHVNPRGLECVYNHINPWISSMYAALTIRILSCIYILLSMQCWRSVSYPEHYLRAWKQTGFLPNFSQKNAYDSFTKFVFINLFLRSEQITETNKKGSILKRSALLVFIREVLIFNFESAIFCTNHGSVPDPDPRL